MVVCNTVDLNKTFFADTFEKLSRDNSTVQLTQDEVCVCVMYVEKLYNSGHIL